MNKDLTKILQLIVEVQYPGTGIHQPSIPTDNSSVMLERSPDLGNPYYIFLHLNSSQVAKMKKSIPDMSLP